MQLKQLRYFITVADCGSINKAAEKLFTSQSNVSKVIKAFEKKANVELFNRNSKGVRLTDKGYEIYDYVKRVLENVDIIESISCEKSSKKLNISCHQNYVISKVLCNYYEQYKEENIKIHFLEENVEQIIDNVKNYVSEFGIVYILSNQKCCFTHNLNHKNLEFHILDTQKLCIYVGKNNPLYNKESITIKEILNLKFVQLTRDFFSLEQYLENFDIYKNINKKSFSNIITTNSNYIMNSLIENTDICKFGFNFKNKDYETLNIKAIDIIDCSDEVCIGYVTRKNESLSNKSINFIKILKSEICK